ncbi:MAG: NAD(P)-binding protein [Gammaproteobacteria bacterium]|nr:NAD(P)-binding protein [Gammaproteobacteria bacterium]
MSYIPKHVIVLGGGPAGLATGHEVSTKGGKVTVLEKNDYVGGLCRTVEDKGYRFDLGGHRWFSKNEDLNNWFRNLMSGEIVMVERISRIYYKRKFFFYPIRIVDIFKNTGPLTMLHAGLAFLWSITKQSFREQPIVTMRDAYVSQFGTKLYDMFFRMYSEKVWGKPCSELSADWVSQRSKGLSVWTTVRDALIGSDNKVTSLIEEFMYPRFGYMRIPERMAEDIQSSDGDVLLGSAVRKIHYHGPNDFEVVYENDGQEQRVRGDAVVSTIPLGFLAHILTPECGDDVKEAARALEFRDLITVNVRIRRKQVSPDTWLYIQDSDILFGRFHEPKNWSADMVPDDEHTSLVLECFCTMGDEIWNMSDDEIADRCVADLVEKLHFIEQDEYEGATVVRTRFAYPVYDLDYSKNIATINDFLATFEGLNICGRGGIFRYNNADHSIEMGLMLGQKLLGYDIDHMAVNTEDDYQEIIGENEAKRDKYIYEPPEEFAARIAQSAQQN